MGRTWEDWIELWWKWCYAEPETTSPVADNTGILADKNQNQSNVWFLAGTFGGNAVRKCTIPAGRSILVPVVNDLISYANYSHLKTEEQLRSYAKDDLDTTTVLKARIDGLALQYLQIMNYRVQSNLFDLILPIDTSRDVSIKHSQAVSDGYWLFLKPLSFGSHIIVISGEKSLYDDVQYLGYKGKNGRFKTNVTYYVAVR
jgi:hypothetical protein